MNCDKFVNNISLYIDNELNDIEKREFELHLMKCDSCRVEYESMINIVKILREEEQVELPEEYRASLREKLIEASNKQKRKVSWKFIASIAACLLVFFTSYELISNNDIFNLGNSEYSLEQGNDLDTQQEIDGSDDVMIMAKESNIEKPKEAMIGEMTHEELESKDVATQDALADSNNTAVDSGLFSIASDNLNQLKDNNNVNGLQASRSIMSNRKTIKEAYIDITVTEFDNTVNEIIDFVNANNGFAESMSIDEMQPSISTQPIAKKQIIKIRISQDKFEDVVNYIKNLGLINNSQCSIMDVTESYESINNSLTQLYDKETRLGEILAKLDDDRDKMIIEEEILEVREQIDNYNVTLENMQDSSNLSTINATIIEGENETEEINENSDDNN